MNQEGLTADYGIRRVVIKLLFSIADFTFIPGRVRSRIFKFAGIKINCPETVFIGQGVVFDSVHPEDISIGKNTLIAGRCVILSHFVNHTWDDHHHMKRGCVNIGNNVFIGVNTAIVRPVTIGDGAIIGANAVVTCDIPPYTIWGGNPAKQIKERIIINGSK